MKISLKNEETCLRLVSSILALITLLLTSCSTNHLINDKQFLAITEKTFNERKQLASHRDSALFNVFTRKLSQRQSEALKFLYAYMPLNDLADYNGDFFLANIDIALQARSESIWGKNIPEDIFLHYILPLRVNNENLDSFRIVYYNELMNRVKGNDIREAALEINHWCHEKVTYQSADIRTSAPMSTILSARGRCGEESTFTVAALRTIGIPARQVYTPRWAHSDDNHAWVEIWYNGGWYYMGACEPEPALDCGWFTEPARRAMLVHTKSFGTALGNENAITRHTYFTDVNNLAKYAVTKRIYVKVLDKDDIPLKDARVEYQLYNYAEFYPLVVVPTDENGISEFETGLGDLLIWAHKDDNFDFKKISVAETDTLILKPVSNENNSDSQDLDLAVPPIRFPFPGLSQELINENADRIKSENIIRQNYIGSWIKPSGTKKLALSLNLDTVRLTGILSRSMGNYKEISSFLSETPDSLRGYAVSLLEILPDKDLRDTKGYILSDHLINSPQPAKLKAEVKAKTKAKAKAKAKVKVEVETGEKIFLEYVLNPRIANELLLPWRHYFLTKLPFQILKNGSYDPSLIVQYLNDNIRIDDEENYYQIPISPIGVNELKVSDKASRAICFVAICRSLGVPSRLEPASNVPQYYVNQNWTDVYFHDQKAPDLKKGFLRLKSIETNPVPEYYIHFTLARFEEGRYNTLEYDFNKKISDFKEELTLSPGKYLLVTGNRLNDSKILASLSFFDLSENEHKTIEVKIRKDTSSKKMLGTIDLKKVFALIDTTDLYQSCSDEKDLVFIWIEPDKEPSRHILNELPLLKKELDAWGGKFVFLDVINDHDHSLLRQTIKGLPANTSFAIDSRMTVLRNSIKIIPSPDFNLPFVLIADKVGNINFISSGYRIGLAEQILKSVR